MTFIRVINVEDPRPNLTSSLSLSLSPSYPLSLSPFLLFFPRARAGADPKGFHRRRRRRESDLPSEDPAWVNALLCCCRLRRYKQQSSRQSSEHEVGGGWERGGGRGGELEKERKGMAEWSDTCSDKHNGFLPFYLLDRVREAQARTLEATRTL